VYEGDKKNYKMFIENLKGKDDLGVVYVYGKIILKGSLGNKGYEGVNWVMGSIKEWLFVLYYFQQL
jgi:hypothetical protein